MQFKHIHVVGCGGTGSYLIDPLLRLMSYHPNGCCNVTLYDGDEYEKKNNVRQIVGNDAIDTNKAEATKNRILQQIPNVNVNVVPYFIDEDSFITYLLSENTQEDKLHLIVMCVDNERARYDVIRAADHCNKKHGIDFAMVLPGNEYNTAQCLWYVRKDDFLYSSHPFDNAYNWAHPTDKPRGSCQYEAVSTPQLLTANFAASFMSLLVVEKLLNDQDLPYLLRYDSATMSITTEGSFQ